MTSASYCSSTFHCYKKDERSEEDHNEIICFAIVCDNAVMPTKTLLRKQRRKRQLQQLKEQRRRQQRRPIYNRSMSVNSFASASRQSPRLSRQAQSKADHSHGSRKKINALSLLFNDSYVLSPRPASQENDEEQDAIPTTPKLSNISDLKIRMTARRLSPVSVMDAPFLLSPTTLALEDAAGDGASQFGGTPKMGNIAARSGISRKKGTRSGLARGDSLSSLLDIEAPLASPIVANRKQEMESATMSPRCTRWSLLRQESDSALMRSSRSLEKLKFT